MTIDDAKNEIPDFETYAKICCDNCSANDWYCPSYCPELEKASSIPFNIIQEKYAKYDGDLSKVVRYIKNTKRGATWLRELKAYRNKSQERDDESCDEIWEKAYAESEGKKMNDSFELTLNNPLIKEDWDKIMDVELENTPSVTFKTPKGKEVKYIKADILDKIKAEIEEKEFSLNCTEVSDVASKTAYIEALKIVDKYKAESEE